MSHKWNGCRASPSRVTAGIDPAMPNGMEPACPASDRNSDGCGDTRIKSGRDVGGVDQYRRLRDSWPRPSHPAQVFGGLGGPSSLNGFW